MQEEPAVSQVFWEAIVITVGGTRGSIEATCVKRKRKMIKQKTIENL